MKKSSIILIAVAALVVITVGVYALSVRSNDTPDDNSSTTQDASSVAATITYDENGFSPASITVHSGDTIAVKNTGSSALQFDSDPHPIHTNNGELNIDDVDPGKGVTFTVTKKGTFGYHNHRNASDTGVIIVE